MWTTPDVGDLRRVAETQHRKEATYENRLSRNRDIGHAHGLYRPVATRNGHKDTLPADPGLHDSFASGRGSQDAGSVHDTLAATACIHCNPYPSTDHDSPAGGHPDTSSHLHPRPDLDARTHLDT